MKKYFVLLVFLLTTNLTARMDPSRPHLTPSNCWGECPDRDTEKIHDLSCEYVPASKCRALSISCVGGFLLKYKNKSIRGFMNSRNYSSKDTCLEHRKTVLQALEIID